MIKYTYFIDLSINYAFSMNNIKKKIKNRSITGGGWNIEIEWAWYLYFISALRSVAYIVV